MLFFPSGTVPQPRLKKNHSSGALIVSSVLCPNWKQDCSFLCFSKGNHGDSHACCLGEKTICYPGLLVSMDPFFGFCNSMRTPGSLGEHHLVCESSGHFSIFYLVSQKWIGPGQMAWGRWDDLINLSHLALPHTTRAGRGSIPHNTDPTPLPCYRETHLMRMGGSKWTSFMKAWRERYYKITLSETKVNVSLW